MTRKKGGSNGSNAHKCKTENTTRVESKQKQKTPKPATLVVASIIGVALAVSAAYSRPRDASTSPQECGLYIAESSLPNAGLGLYTGRPYENLAVLGLDHIVPIFDMDEHQGSGWPFLWNAYTWNPDNSPAQEARQVSLANFGFGAVGNAHLDLWNAKLKGTETAYPWKQNDGASSPYRQQITAREDLQAGQELFNHYGDDWFIRRTKFMGLIPLEGDVNRADAVLQKWNALRDTHDLSTTVFSDFWERFVWKNPYAPSRVLNAMPTNWTKLKDAMDRKSLKRHLQQETVRSIEWLEENGVCADNIKEGPSQISGSGAFATRFLPKSKTVATLPLIHIPFRARLRMNTPPYHQLLLNYCYGHSQSTMLLCPYGPSTSFINHDSNKPNVKIVWANPKTSSSHQPEWLHLGVADIHRSHQKAGLAFELVTIRDISEGEEVLLDYGDEWEAAWRQHVATHGKVVGKAGEGPYSSALHAPNAFRHDIRMPDEIFPVAWKNQPNGHKR